MRLFQTQLRPVLHLCAVLLVALPVLIALPQHAAPQAGIGPLVFAVDPAQSTVHWTLGSSLHTVHGTFALKRGSLQVHPVPGKASGEIVVDAASCLRADDWGKLFFGRIALPENSKPRENQRYKFTGFFYCMAASTN